jgi:hypothetical protein
LFLGTYEVGTGEVGELNTHIGNPCSVVEGVLCSNCSVVLARLYSFLNQSEDFVTLVHTLWCGDVEFEPAFARGKVCGVLYNIERELQKKHDSILGIKDTDLLDDLTESTPR